MQAIGRYVAVERIGAGGMGEVWRGHDPRLDRPIALKQIRPDRAEHPGWRQRLRNEARAVAKLSHPAIVQVYDIVEQPAGDWIVMEYLEGDSLARLLDRGPLDNPRLVSLARDITSALAEAHRKGILHRDLKTENVMVTRDGRAKVLDFGLAKASAGSVPDLALSGEGTLLGTLRAMSPEQAMGHTLDHRSDLFSLGVLLYEMATATSPFAAATSAGTLTRICTFRPPPVHERAPSVPVELSDLIDRLLAKERDARPRDADAVDAALARIADRRLAPPPAPALGPSLGGETLDRSIAPALAPSSIAPATDRSHGIAAMPPGSRIAPATDHSHSIAPATDRSHGIAPATDRARSVAPTAAALRPRTLVALIGLAALAASSIAIPLWISARPAEPRYVAVPMPELRATAPGSAPGFVASSLRVALLTGLVKLEGVAPLVVDPDATATSPVSVARLEAADEILVSRLDCDAQTCRASLMRVRGRDGSALWIDSFDIPIADPQVAAKAAAVSLRRGYADHPTRAAALDDTTRAEDYEAYLRLFLRFQRRDAGLDSQAMLDELTGIRRRSPRFLEAYVLDAQLAGLRFFDSRDPADLERAFHRVAEARALAPDDPRPLLALLNVAIPADRLDDAETALRALDALVPGHTQIRVWRALVLERRGQTDRALALMRQAAHQRPSWATLLDLANLEYRLGDIPAATRTLTDLLDRFPGHIKGLTLLAQIELLSGSLDRAAQRYEELVRRAPGLAEISNLGLAQMLRGHHVEAAESFRRAVDLAPRSAATVLNLADAELLRGRTADAHALYAQTLTLVEADPAPGLWQNLTIQGQALAHLDRTPAARAAAQRALAENPDNPQVAFETALIFALIGDTAEAERQRDRALRGGVQPRWFDLPWFDALRTGAPRGQHRDQ